MTPRTTHAVSGDALADHDATALAELVADGELTATELTAAAIERVRLLEPELSALVVDCFDEATARSATPLTGAFAGVPTVVKDMSDLEGHPTRWGSDALAEAAPAKRTAPEVAQLLDMGMSVLAKTTLPEFGIICSAEFPDAPATRNPWNLDHTPGGSSSGSAALVAAGAIPIAHAADGGGSIRIPASACGLVGVKATRGRIVEDPAARFMPVRVATHGVVSRTVRDSWNYLAAAEALHPTPSLDAVGPLGAPLDRMLRIGVISETSTGAVLDAATLRVLDETVELLESLGHQVEQVANPVAETMAEDFILNYGFLCLMITKGGRRLFDPSFDASAITPVVQGFADQCRANLRRMPGVWRRLRASTAQAADLFRRNDVILTPTVGQLPPPIGYFDTNLGYEELIERVAEWACFTPWDNATGCPAVSLPLGHDAASNLPIGMMFHADIGRERLLLELSLQLEGAQPWRRITDPIAAATAQHDRPGSTDERI